MSPTSLAKPIIRPSSRDLEPQLFGRSLSPDEISTILDSGSRGDLHAQNDLFNLMEDTWPRLRANLQKIKTSVRKLPLNIQPYSPKNGKPSAAAQEKAAFVESALQLNRGDVDTTRGHFSSALYDLLDAVARGVAVVEITWSTNKDGFLYPTGFLQVPSQYIGVHTDASLALRLPVSGFGAQVFGYNAALTPFSKYPGKFLTAVFRTKAGSIGEAAQLRTLAPLWLGSMLGWEWLVQKAELFGTPLRWANYPTNATQLEIDAITDALINMGTASWGAFPAGTNLQLFHGSVPGVAGPNDPSERLMAMADRACDIMFLGQNLAVEGTGAASKAATQVHREVELDLFESYADFIADIINTQLIPELIGLNWGNKDELPFVQVELPRPKQEQELADRDKTLFLEMGLPVSLQYLYERHKIPTPDADAELFVPVSPFGIPTATPAGPESPAADSAAPTAGKNCACGCAAPIDAASESGQSFAEREAKAYATFSGRVLQAEANDEYLVWDSTLDAKTTAFCQARHGRRWGDGWLTPPPAHFNCRSVLVSVPKADYKAPIDNAPAL